MCKPHGKSGLNCWPKVSPSRLVNEFPSSGVIESVLLLFR